MTSSSQAAKTDKLFCFPWMASREFDLLWFFAPLLIAAVATVVLQYQPFASPGLLFLFVVNAFGIGPMHQGPTWFFYFDKKNNEYWAQDRMRQCVYYLGPVLVFIASVALAIAAPGIGMAITVLWGVQHFIQQNLGMCTLYHNKNAGEAVVARPLLSRSLWTPAVFFVSIFFYRILFPGQDSIWALAVFTLLGLLALFDVGRYLNDVRRQVAEGARINAPAFMFWAVSVLYFLPFTWPGQRLDIVFLIPGTMHWCQYIGLNLILIRHKYDDENRKVDIPCSAQILMALLCVVSLAAFLGTHALKLDFSINSLYFKLFLGMVVGMANVHYYQDAFFWRFREKFQRDSILPYLLKARRPAAS